MAKRSKSSDVAFDVSSFRQKTLAAHVGNKEVSRNYLAKLLSVQPLKVAGWEKKKAVPGDIAVRLHDLQSSVESGHTKLVLPKRGRVAGSAPKAGGRKRAAAAAAPKASRASVDVKKLRAASGLSLARFAKEMKVSVGTVQNWQKGGKPRAEALARLQAFAARGGSGNGTAPVAARRGRAASSASHGGGDHLTLARTLFDTAIHCSPAAREKLLVAAAALLGE